MNFYTLNINSAYKLSGTIDNFTIKFPWSIIYSPDSIKVLSVTLPSTYSNLKSNTIYITSNIIGGIDNGYFPVANSNIRNSVIAVVDATQSTYYSHYSDPYFISRGTKFGQKYHLPQPDKSITLALQNPDGSYVGSLTDWNIVIICYANIVSPGINVNF